MLETGKVLQNRYRIERQIGQGGMGAVYVATDERFGSRVAIKETLCMDGNYRKAIEREARLLNSLKHPALPRVTDHFLENESQFIVMEYIPGEDLCCVMDAKGSAFTFDSVAEWADQLLDALDFLHNQTTPVIHRDIKPQNLKITPEGRIALLDFGLAKGNPTDAGQQTAAKSIFGYSRNYASLEQIQGTGTDPRSDLYSLAATLYHLLTGRAPEDALTRAMSVLSEGPDPLLPADHINPDVPPGFAFVLHRALDLNAGARPGTAREMREMLRDHDSSAKFAKATAVSLKRKRESTEISSQETMLLPGATIPREGGLGGAKTEIMPTIDSIVTTIRPEATDGISAKTINESQPTRRGRSLGLAAAGVLLMAVAAAAYIYGPSSLFGRGSEVPADQAIEPMKDPAAGDSAVSGTVPTAEAADAAETKITQPEVRSPADRPQEKQPTRTARNPVDPKTPQDPDEVIVLDPANGRRSIYIGNLKIGDGKVERPGAFTFRKDPPPLTPEAPRPGPLDEPRGLTPMQRRQIQELRRRGLIEPIDPKRSPTKP